MLARMEITHEEGRPVSFSITFIKENGRTREMVAQNHVKHGAITKQPEEKSKFRFNLKKAGTILLFDTKANGYRTVRIDRILTFNGLEVIH